MRKKHKRVGTFMALLLLFSLTFLPTANLVLASETISSEIIKTPPASEDDDESSSDKSNSKKNDETSPEEEDSSNSNNSSSSLEKESTSEKIPSPVEDSSISEVPQPITSPEEETDSLPNIPSSDPLTEEPVSENSSTEPVDIESVNNSPVLDSEDLNIPSSPITEEEISSPTTVSPLNQETPGEKMMIAPLNIGIIDYIDLYPQNLIINAGETEQFSALAYDIENNEVPTNFQWQSSNESVGTIDNNGTFTALSSGTTTITVSSNGISAQSEVTVESIAAAIPASIVIYPSTLTLIKGETHQFTALVYDIDGNEIGSPLSWQSSDETIGIIDSSGLFSALKAGTTTVTVSTSNQISASTVVQVNKDTNPQLPTIYINPLATSSPMPTITGSISDPQAIIDVSINGTIFSAVNNGDGSWKIDWPETLTDGTYDVSAQATGDGYSVTDNSTNELTISLITPITITVSPLTTSQSSPQLTGTIDSNAATIEVTINGLAFSAINNQDGSWSLPAGSIQPPLDPGTYEVQAFATDLAGNIGTDLTVNELVINAPQPVLSSLAIVPQTISLTVGDTYLFSFEAIDQFGNPIVVTPSWSSSDPTLASIDQTGLLSTLQAGTVTVTVSADTFSAQATVTINDVAPVVSSLEISPLEVTLQPGESYQFTAIAYDDQGNELANAPFVWSSSDPTLASIDQTGLLSALQLGTLTVTVTTDFFSAQATVNIIENSDTTPPLITVNPLTTESTSPELTGTVDDFNAAISIEINGLAFSAINNQDGSWSLPAGSIQPPLDPGTYEVQAFATDLAGNIGTDPTVNELVILPSSLLTITINNLTTNEQNPTLTGAVSDPQASITIIVNGISYEATNNGDGTWTAYIFDSLPPGTYDVRATATNADGSQIAEDNTTNELIIISEPVITSLMIIPYEATLNPGQTQQFEIEALDEFGSPLEVSAIWSISDPTLATIDETGLLTALNPGIVSVQANVGDLIASAQVIIEENIPQVASLEIYPTELTILAEENAYFSAIAFDDAGNELTNISFSWSTSDETLATIDDTGLFQALQPGTVTVTVESGGITTTATVTIKESTSDLILEIYPEDLTLYIGQEENFVLKAFNAEGIEIEITDEITWTSSDEEIGLIDSLGIFTAIAAGETNITAELANQSITIQVVVLATNELSVSIDSILTNNPSPELTGEISDPQATLIIELAGAFYEAINNQDGTWSLPAGDIENELGEGEYVIKVLAENENGGQTEAEGTLTIDLSAPIIEGVSNGETYEESVSPTFNEGTATLNGQPFTSGEIISQEGSYTLVVTDEAGNIRELSFSITSSQDCDCDCDCEHDCDCDCDCDECEDDDDDDDNAYVTQYYPLTAYTSPGEQSPTDDNPNDFSENATNDLTPSSLGQEENSTLLTPGALEQGVAGATTTKNTGMPIWLFILSLLGYFFLLNWALGGREKIGPLKLIAIPAIATAIILGLWWNFTPGTNYVYLLTAFLIIIVNYISYFLRLKLETNPEV